MIFKLQFSGVSLDDENNHRETIEDIVNETIEAERSQRRNIFRILRTGINRLRNRPQNEETL